MSRIPRDIYGNPISKLYISDGRGNYPLINLIVLEFCNELPGKAVLLKTKKFNWNDLTTLCLVGDTKLLKEIWEDTEESSAFRGRESFGGPDGGIFPNHFAIQRAAGRGKLETFRWLLNMPGEEFYDPRRRSTPITSFDIDFILTSMMSWIPGDNILEVLVYFEKFGIIPSNECTALKVGHFAPKVLDWLEARGIYPNPRALLQAQDFGRLERLQTLKLVPVLDHAVLVQFANCAIDTKILDYLESLGALPSGAVIRNPETLAWCEARGILPRPNDYLIHEPVSRNLEVLKKLYKNYGFRPTSNDVRQAIIYGDIEILFWIEEKTPELLETVRPFEFDFFSSLLVQHPKRVSKILDWMTARKMFPKQREFSHIIMFLNIFYNERSVQLFLDWAIKLGMLVTSSDLYDIASRGFVDTLNWLEKKGIYLDGEDRKRGFSSTSFVDFMVNGFDCIEKLTLYYGDCLPVLKYFQKHEVLIPVKTDTLKILSSRGYLDCLKYLYEQGIPLSQESIVAAEENGYTDIANWIRARRDL